MLNSKTRASYLKTRYGITAAQWNRMFQRQEGKCPICEKLLYKPKNKFGKMAANVDHDHKTGRVRGLLCWLCNRKRVGNLTLSLSQRITDYLASDFDGRQI